MERKREGRMERGERRRVLYEVSHSCSRVVMATNF